MLEDIDLIEASCLFYVKIDIINQLKQSEIGFLTITLMGIIMLAILHHLIIGICVT
jgi:hypothetical protein